MNALFLGKAIVAGMIIGAPVGPVGMVCLHRLLTKGRLTGMVSGMGAATADGLYGCIIGLGLTMIIDLLKAHHVLFRILGAIVMLLIGLKIILIKPSLEKIPIRRRGLVGNYLSALFLMLSNPIIILAIIAVFAVLEIGSVNGNNIALGFLGMGVFIGSCLWWGILTSTVGLFGHKLTIKGARIVNISVGSLLILTALVAITSGIISKLQG